MKHLIDNISDVVKKTKYFTFALLQSEIKWIKDYPIAVVHNVHKAKSESTGVHFRELVGEDGITPNQYTDEQLIKLGTNTAESFQYADFVALKSTNNPQINFAEKNENDFWKKIQNVDHIDATFDSFEFSSDDDKCKVEFELREIIRKRKEVHALKDVGFIWMAVSSNDMSEVFTHYFGDNHIHVDNKYYIGWSDKLRDINMRYFVCQPN